MSFTLFAIFQPQREGASGSGRCVTECVVRKKNLLQAARVYPHRAKAACDVDENLCPHLTRGRFQIKCHSDDMLIVGLPLASL